MAFGLTAGAAMLIGGGVGAAASIYGANKASGAAKDAANAQSASAAQSLDLQKQMFDKQNELNAPFRENGLTGQNRLMDLLGLSKNTDAAGYGSAAKTFDGSQLSSDPGYQWRLDQGQKALERSSAARGGLLSGAAVKAASDYGQGSASQEYQNAYNRFQTDKASILNPLQSMAGQGQSASNQMGQAAQAYGANAGNTMTQAGNAQASGYVGQANAINSGIGQAVNGFQNYNMMSQLFPTSNSTGYFNGAPGSGNIAGSSNFMGPMQ